MFIKVGRIIESLLCFGEDMERIEFLCIVSELENWDSFLRK